METPPRQTLTSTLTSFSILTLKAFGHNDLDLGHVHVFVIIDNCIVSMDKCVMLTLALPHLFGKILEWTIYSPSAGFSGPGIKWEKKIDKIPTDARIYQFEERMEKTHTDEIDLDENDRDPEEYINQLPQDDSSTNSTAIN